MVSKTAWVNAARGKAIFPAAPRKGFLIIKYPFISGLFFAFA